MLVDMPLERLREHRPEAPAAQGFEEFWSSTLATARSHDVAVERSPWAVSLPHVLVEDVTFSGYDGQRVRGWLLRPLGATGPLPCVVMFEGYGGGRGLPHEWLFWPAAGAAVLVMDVRGQGSGHRRGDTPDLGPASGPHQSGFLTLGLQSPETYYYRRLFTDAARAVDAARSLPEVDPARVVVGGASQGGGITLATAGLVPDVAAAMPDVPFLCHVERAVEITDAFPYQELRLWLRMHPDDVEQALATVALFDGVTFAQRATAPALFSVGLMDDVCPPSTVFAAHNHYAGPARMQVWPYSGHEGGGAAQALHQLAFLRELGILPA